MTLLARQNRAPNSIDEATPASSGAEVNAVLGHGSVFEGKLAFEGTVHINGTFKGEIHSSDTLIIGEGGKVHADVEAGTVIVTGEVTGTIKARQVLEMHAPARVKGTVMSPVLIIERGVVFEGNCRMENLDSAAPSADRPVNPPS